MKTPASARPRIYQLLVRTFGNECQNRMPGGSMEENGCGKFDDINEAALRSLRNMGFTHLWLTGVIEHASATAYPHRPADPSCLVKGRAGSPYAIRDYFDVCPDFAVNPENRLEEFRELLQRCNEAGFRVLIDFVPNHVARSYESDVKPEWSFGLGDDPRHFFLRDNHFYYLQSDHPGGGPPLRLPLSHQNETQHYEEWLGRVTGNNVVSWQPGIHDWYETVKLNYGHDFTQGRDSTHLPSADASIDSVPKTWRIMDEIIGYWQEMGVDGFRADMAHMIPLDFWRWLIQRSRQKKTEVYWMAEAYDNDPAKLSDGHIMDDLLEAGFDAVYDDPLYDVLMGIYDEGKWCNDIDDFLFTGERFHRSLRYGENHDEVRLAHPREWGGHGMAVGRPVCAVSFAMGRGPIMIYHGQELGEQALGKSGFADDNGRTTIFDYWSLPSLQDWIAGKRYDENNIEPERRALRDWYGRLLRLMAEPAFERGEFYGLNFANRNNPMFGRIDGEVVSGHWVYAFLRHDRESGQKFLCVVNFHPQQSMMNLRVIIPLGSIGDEEWADCYEFVDQLTGASYGQVVTSMIIEQGMHVSSIPPLQAVMLEWKKVSL
jgi:glycosidase